MRSMDLAFYGISHHWYIPYFGSLKGLVAEVLKRNNIEVQNGNITTVALRQLLNKAGIDAEKCTITNCNHRAQIHHIFPKSMRTYVKWDIHTETNLIPLCPNHHSIGHKFNPKMILQEEPSNWRAVIRAYIEAIK